MKPATTYKRSAVLPTKQLQSSRELVSTISVTRNGYFPFSTKAPINALEFFDKFFSDDIAHQSRRHRTLRHQCNHPDAYIDQTAGLRLQFGNR